MSQPDLTAIIANLRRWEPVMRDASTHATGLQADSQPERAAFTKDRFLRDLELVKTSSSLGLHSPSC